MDEEMDYKNHEIINLKTTITSIESKMQSDRERKLRLEEDIVEYDNRHLKLLDDFKNLQLGRIQKFFFILRVSLDSFYIRFFSGDLEKVVL